MPSLTLELSVPDVSRERRCLQRSPEQLVATKANKTINLNFRPREAREFLGRRDTKFKHCKDTEIPHLGSLPSGGQKFLGKNRTII